MMDLLLTNAGDLPDLNQLVGGRTHIRQRISLRLQRHLGEWFLNTTEGLPFERWSQQKPVDLAEVVARVRTEVEAVQGVVGTRGFEARQDLATRRVTVTGEFVLEDGTTESLTVTNQGTGNVSTWNVYFTALGVF